MNDELTLESILQKDVADLSEQERDHLNEHKSQLTVEQTEKFSTVLSDDAANPAKDGESNGDDEEKTNE